jgi:hypothetical protein
LTSAKGSLTEAKGGGFTGASSARIAPRTPKTTTIRPIKPQSTLRILVALPAHCAPARRMHKLSPATTDRLTDRR